MNTKEKIELLWAEYRYRHEHIWATIYKITTAVVTISIVPYLNINVVHALGYKVLLLPVLGVLLAIFSLLRMFSELKLFLKIKKKYIQIQNKSLLLINQINDDDMNNFMSFKTHVIAYFFVLISLGVIHILIMKEWVEWVASR